jgi:hypothetical protein
MGGNRTVAVVPTVRLGQCGDGSVAAAVYAIVDRAVAKRPEVVEELAGHDVRFELGGGCRPVRVRFGRHEVEVADDDDDGPVDLVVHGSLPDLQTLLVAPLTKGVPRSRAALARLADGRVSLDGPMVLGRRVLRLLALP